MIGPRRETSTHVLADMREFDKVAAGLGMPDSERLSILGLDADAYAAWQAGDVDMAEATAPALVRRLGYAFPLMRRMAANLPMLPAGRRQDPQPAMSQANGSGSDATA